MDGEQSAPVSEPNAGTNTPNSELPPMLASVLSNEASTESERLTADGAEAYIDTADSHPERTAESEPKSLLLQPAAMAVDDAAQTLAAPEPPQQSMANEQPPPVVERRLDVTDALTYLDAVKTQFADQPDVYNRFLDIMKEFKSQHIDTPGVIKRVSHLFNGHPFLIQGFNTFLPPGYRIECAIDEQDGNQVIVTTVTPSGTTVQAASSEGKQPIPAPPADEPMAVEAAPEPEPAKLPPPPPPSSPPRVPNASSVPPDEFNIEPALQYVQKIKQRCDSETYKEFLEILSRYHHIESIDQDDVSRRISRLFKNDPELQEEFRIFLTYDLARKSRPGSPEHKSKRKFDDGPMPVTSSSAPAKRPKRKEKERGDQREQEVLSTKTSNPTHTKKTRHTPVPDSSYHASKYSTGYSAERRTAQQYIPVASSTRPANDDSQFFDRVKQTLDNRETYNEFLKVVNLFTQGYIDTARLIEKSQHFLIRGDGALMQQWKDILGWDEKREREQWHTNQQQQFGWSRPSIAGIQDRPTRADLTIKYGSYRRLPANEVNVPCSGRDEMCKSVLNDEWVSHMASEDVGFFSPPRNMYEEALHRSEEERHEYDFHIEALVRTIALLEPITNKIAMLSPEERGNFKLKPNLGGSAKAIHYRIIKKIYGREAGLEVIQTMQDSPAVSIPVILQRLKQKEEEWKRAQREWIRVWREVDARNYAKSLDHQSISFKASDKKAITTKAFVSQIEAAREEQMSRRASLIDPLFARTRPRHQLEFVIEDFSVMQDALKLIFSFLDRTQAQIHLGQRRRIEVFLRSFVPLFFMLNASTFNEAFVVANHDGGGVESDVSDAEVTSVGGGGGDAEVNGGGSGTSPPKKIGGKKSAGNGSGGDLRKKLLKSEQAKSTIRKTRAQDGAPSPTMSRMGSPVAAEDIGHSSKRGCRRNSFFTNTSFYVLLRMLELLYSRLHLFKTLGAKIASQSANTGVNPIASHLGIATPECLRFGDQQASPEHYYDFMLEACELLFDNQVEQFVFEDQMRYMFGIQDAYKIFTIDKLVGALIKQVQAIFADPKSQELLELLKRDRTLAPPTTQDFINSLSGAEKILGPDENLFRIEWLPDSKMMTMQLIGKDDSSFDDSEVLTGRWQAYIDSFVSSEETEGVSRKELKRPFLRRNLPKEGTSQPPDVVSEDGLEIKICVRTYRIFYVSKTEDFLWRIRKLRPKSR